MTVGRPKEFDRDEALKKAMELFWTRGYEATGLRDLLDHMGIGRQSLYDTFGDKHSLFVAAVKHYNQCITEGIIDQLRAAGSPLQNVRETLAAIADTVTDGKCRGCLLTNTLVEVAPHDSEVAAAAKSVLTRIENGFRCTLQQAVKEGELPKDANVRALARYFTSTLQGLVVMGKASVSRAAVKDIVNVALSVLER
jgi:TetR/AcrR family transcriptional repressor of nem operon